MDCCFCSESIDNGDLTVTLTKKGCRNINSISQTLNQCTIQVKTGQCIHNECRLISPGPKKQEAVILTRTKEQLSLASHVDHTETARTALASCTDSTETASKVWEATSQIGSSIPQNDIPSQIQFDDVQAESRNESVE